MQQKNDMRTYLKFVILLVLFASCGFFQPQWVYLSNGGKQAVSSAYHLSKENFVCSPLIDTNIVYIWESELVTVNRYGEKIEGPSTKYQLMCFNSNGICFLTPLTKIYLTDIEVKQYIELNWGQYCYYKVDGSKIVVEVYNYHTKFLNICMGIS